MKSSKISVLASSVIQRQLIRQYSIAGVKKCAGLNVESGNIQSRSPKFDDQDWLAVEIKANDRQDFSQPCPICKDELGCREHVLLSCSHVFHKNCIKLFEKFTSHKVCPLCRQQQYQMKTVQNGEQIYLSKCATKIQSVWRMHVARSIYNNIRTSIPPLDPALRKKYFECKLASLVERMTKLVCRNLDAFMEEFDKNIERSRNVFNILSCTFDWDSIIAKIAVRGEEKCPICLVKLDKRDLKSKYDNNSQQQISQSTECERKPVYVLSCSHVFHQSCLNMYESFSKQHICPTCRSSYVKK